MEKVWNEGKEIVILILDSQFKETLENLLNEESGIRKKAFLETREKWNNQLIRDKNQILELHRKFGVEDVVFNNKTVIYKIKMKVKEDEALVKFEEHGKQMYFFLFRLASEFLKRERLIKRFKIDLEQFENDSLRQIKDIVSKTVGYNIKYSLVLMEILQ